LKVHLVIAIRRAFERAPSASLWSSREPIREELFSVERLEEHGRSLAAAQPVTQRPAKGHPLATRVAENGAILLGAYRSIVKATEEASAITPAAEALIDNYYLVEKHIRELRSDLPPGFYRQLPKLHSKDILEFSVSLGLLSPMATVPLTSRCWSVTCERTKRSNR
jgi:cyclic beta-1,2-glucan synthetase